MLLYFVRHGDPNYEKDCLTERGKLQAEAVGKRLAAAKIDRVFTSPMGRAKATAEPLCRMLNKEYTVEDWAYELTHNEFFTEFPDGRPKSSTGLSGAYFRANGMQDLPFDRAFECPIMHSTKLDLARSRVLPNLENFLERMGYKKENGVYKILWKNEERVAFFCHGALLRLMLSELLHIPLNLVWSGFFCSHTGVTVLHFKNYDSGFTTPICYTFSDMAHLFAADLDMKHDNGVSI